MATELSQNMLLVVPLAPLAGALIAGLAGKVDRPPRGARRHHPRRADLVHRLGDDAVLGGDRRRTLQCHRLRVDDARRPEDGGRLPDRRPVGHDDVRGHLRLADGAHLHDRLHGGRSGLPALLQLHLAVHLQHADAGDEQQLPAAVLRLGGGRAGQLSADRLLVHPADGDLRQHEGVPGEPGRRLRLHPRHRPDRGVHRQPGLRRGVRAGGRARNPLVCRIRSAARNGC